MTKIWTDDAWDDFLYWTEQDKKTLRQIKKLLIDIDRNGYKGIGHPEPLVGDLTGYWSKHIDALFVLFFRRVTCIIDFMRGISAAGSALHWQCRGHGFEPRMLQSMNIDMGL